MAKAAAQTIMELQSAVDSRLSGIAAPKVLEAGCGSSSRLSMPSGTYLVGIDISQDQLNNNVVLSEKILGDIEEYPLAASEFDMIICWDVLEHLSGPEKAICNFARAIKPGGVIVLAFPNLRSVKGFVTRVSPHWFHVWVYKHVLRCPWAGTSAGPFRTFMEPVIEPSALACLAAENRLETAYSRVYEGGSQENLRVRLHITGPVWAIAKLVVKALSFGRLDAEKTECLMVLEKPQGG